MRRIITLTALAIGLSSGVALADRRGPAVRDHRGDRQVVRTNNNWNRGGNRTVRVQRMRPAFRNGRFYFAGGFYRPYVRPVINVHYRDYYRRPALIVENYDPVPGYIWIQGSWQWSGYEWNWVPGHYEVDQSYSDGGYYDGGY